MSTVSSPRTGTAAELGGRPSADELQLGPSVPLAEKFLMDHDAELAASLSAWREVSATFQPFADGSVLADLMQVYPRTIGDKAGNLSEMQRREWDQVRAKLAKLPSDLATYLLVYFSACSTRDTYPTNSRQLIRETQTPSTRINDALSYLLSSDEYGPGLVRLPSLMSEARGNRKFVVSDLVQLARQNSSIFRDLAQMSQDNSEYGKYLAELRKMCAVDWHNKDPQKSMLRGHIDSLAEDDQAFLADFVEAARLAETENGNGSERLSTVWTMGQLAAAAQGIDINSHPEINAVLLATREQWPQLRLRVIEDAYQAYRRLVIGQMEKEIDTFVGSGYNAMSDIRFPRSEEEVDALRQGFDWYFQPYKSRGKRQGGRVTASAGALPQATKIAAEAAREQEAYKIAVLKKYMGRGHVADTSPEALDRLTKRFKKNPDLLRDVPLMLESLSKDPNSAATEALKSDRTVAITTERGRRNYNMRVYAPQSDPSVKVSEVGLHHRVLYYVVDNMVVVQRICRYDEIDRH